MNLSFISTRRNRIYSYCVYWMLYFLLFWLIESSHKQDYLNVFKGNITGLPLKIFFVILVLEWQMEKYLFKNNTAVFILLYLILLLIFSFLQRVIDNYIIIDYINPGWTKEPLIKSPAFLYNVIKYTFVAAIPFNIKLFAYWSSEQKRAQQNEAKKMQAELNFLRNQFHPHFIFNVLNSLYSKILNGSPTAGDIVLKISSLLRFTIYDINTATISLDKEINYLEDYIALQRIRFDRQLEVSFTVDGDVTNKIIEPFLIIPFIENSFKYCINGDTETGWITIFIALKDDTLTVKIENSLPGNHPATKNRSNDKLNESGIGLQNVKKRLDLLYPDSHTLKITEDADSFFVSLKLKLQSNER